MQTPLDRADRGLELIAHFMERTAVDVERHERFAVHPAQLRQALADLGGPLAGQHPGQRRFRLDRGRFQRLGLQRNVAVPPNEPVDRHARGDLPDPAREGFGRPELVDLLHRLDEDVLAQLLRLAVVGEAPQADGQHMPLEPLEELAEGLPVAGLGAGHQVDQLDLVRRDSVVVQGDGGHDFLSLISGVCWADCWEASGRQLTREAACGYEGKRIGVRKQRQQRRGLPANPKIHGTARLATAGWPIEDRFRERTRN